MLCDKVKARMRKLTSALVLIVFGVNCLLAWGMLTLLLQVRDDAHRVLPWFTNVCIALRPVLVVLPVAAMAYCVWLWLRKPESVSLSVGFVVGTMVVLTVFVLPAIVTSYSLMIDPIKLHFEIWTPG